MALFPGMRLDGGSSLPGGVGGGWGGVFGDIVTNLGTGLMQYQMQKKALKAASKGAPAYALGYSAPAVPGAMSWGGSTSGDPFGIGGSPLGNMLGMGEGSSAVSNPGCFRTGTTQRVSPCKVIRAIGPNGNVYEWVYRGRPLLYSGDLAVARRVTKLLGRGRSVRARGRERCS